MSSYIFRFCKSENFEAFLCSIFKGCFVVFRKRDQSAAISVTWIKKEACFGVVF